LLVVSRCLVSLRVYLPRCSALLSSLLFSAMVIHFCDLRLCSGSLLSSSPHRLGGQRSQTLTREVSNAPPSKFHTSKTLHACLHPSQTQATWSRLSHHTDLCCRNVTSHLLTVLPPCFYHVADVFLYLVSHPEACFASCIGAARSAQRHAPHSDWRCLLLRLRCNDKRLTCRLFCAGVQACESTRHPSAACQRCAPPSPLVTPLSRALYRGDCAVRPADSRHQQRQWQRSQQRCRTGYSALQGRDCTRPDGACLPAESSSQREGRVAALQRLSPDAESPRSAFSAPRIC
jgi:hypothetical protein